MVKSLTFAALVEGRALKWKTNRSRNSSSPCTKKLEHDRQKDLPDIGSNVQRGCRIAGAHIKPGLVGVRVSGRRSRWRLALARARDHKRDLNRAVTAQFSLLRSFHALRQLVTFNNLTSARPEPDRPGPTAAKIVFRVSPSPARPGRRARNSGPSPARWHSWAGPGRASPGRAGRAGLPMARSTVVYLIQAI